MSNPPVASSSICAAYHRAATPERLAACTLTHTMPLQSASDLDPKTAPELLLSHEIMQFKDFRKALKR